MMGLKGVIARWDKPRFRNSVSEPDKPFFEMSHRNILGKENQKRLAITLVMFMAFGLRIYRLDHQSLWWDEMFTGGVAALQMGEMFKESFADRVHPPLYSLLMHYWVELGTGAFVLRYFSVVWGVLVIPFIYRLGRFIKGHRLGMISALLLAISPFHIWYSQDARMYSFVAATVLIANWFLLRTFRHDKFVNWFGYSLFMILAIYTHYLAFFILIAHYAFFALNYRHVKFLFNKWFSFASIIMGTFSLWGVAIMLTGGFKQAAISWVPPANWKHPFATLLVFSAGASIDPKSVPGLILVTLFFSAMFLVFIRYSWRSNEFQLANSLLKSRFLFSWLLIPLLLVLLISYDLPIPQKRSIYMDRYLIILLPAMIVLASWGIVIFWKDKILGMSATLVFASILTIPSLKSMYFDPAFARTDWQKAVAQIEIDWEDKDKMLITPEGVLPLLYYATEDLLYDAIPKASDESEQAFLNEVLPTIENVMLDAGRIWVIDFVPNVDPHGFPQKRNEELSNVASNSRLRRWMDDNFQQPEVYVFTGIQLALYDVGHVINRNYQE